MAKCRVILIFLSVLGLCSCSASSAASIQGLTGSLIGASLGAGGIALAHEADSSIDRSEATALAAPIAAGLGLIAGAVVNEESTNAERAIYYERLPAEPINDLDPSIESTRRAVYDSTKWGQGEVKPWKSRYLGENANRPYQGMFR